jgi:hypothetical protein
MMSHPLYDVVEFKQIDTYTLRVCFDDQTEQIINFEPVLYGEVYGTLREPALFAQVRLDPEVRTLVWPNGADFDPYVLHEWPRAVEQMAQRLRQLVVA